MYGISNCAVRPDTLVSVLRCVSDNGRCSRRYIAEKCGISLMTAGKAVMFFVDKGIFVERLSSKTMQGPRPAEFCLNPKYNCVTFDLYDRNYSAYLTAVSGKEILKDRYEYNRNIFSDDNFARFVRSFAEKTERSHPEYRIGVGIMIPENSCPESEILPVHTTRERYVSSVKEIIDKRLASKRFACRSKGYLAVKYFSSFPEYSEDTTLVYICLNRSEVISEVMVNGKRLIGKGGAGLEVSKMFHGGRSIGYLLSHSESGDEYCEYVASAIANMIACYDPHYIVIDSETSKFTAGMAEIVKTVLTEKYGFNGDTLPEFIVRKNTDPSYFARGMMLVLKEKFIEDVSAQILGDNLGSVKNDK